MGSPWLKMSSLAAPARYKGSEISLPLPYCHPLCPEQIPDLGCRAVRLRCGTNIPDREQRSMVQRLCLQKIRKGAAIRRSLLLLVRFQLSKNALSGNPEQLE